MPSFVHRIDRACGRRISIMRDIARRRGWIAATLIACIAVINLCIWTLTRPLRRSARA